MLLFHIASPNWLKYNLNMSFLGLLDSIYGAISYDNSCTFDLNLYI